MVRHNNMIPNAHFHKDWQRFTRVRLDQPMRKRRRYLTRIKKIKNLTPVPVEKLRPIVNCPSVRYHTKTRLGRGFTLKELKSAKINKNYARTIGIAVDQRRRDKSMETLRENVKRLQVYASKIKMIDKVGNKVKLGIGKQKGGKDGVCNEYLSRVNENIYGGKRKVKNVAENSRVLTGEEKAFKAFETLRKARREIKGLKKKGKKKDKENMLELAK